jgi:hypothetical protein
MNQPAGQMTQDPVVGGVKRLLAESAAFRSLPERDRAHLEQDMIKIGRYLADPGWMTASTPARARALEEEEQPDAVDVLKQRIAEDPGFAGEDFKGGAIAQGTQQFGDLVKTVDFPKFVSGLIQGVFQAVVNASIQQMQAFGELLAATAKSVDQFATDDISDSQARDHIANRYPSAVQVDTSGDMARLKPSGAEGAPNIGAEFGLDEDLDLEDPESEQKLVTAAKLEMARSRQQTMAMMVLLGINRIVVTNGHINAKVVFDMRASDQARRRHKAELKDREAHSAQAQTGWLTNLAGGFEASHEHETTVASSVDETSESKAQVKATLSGDVRLAFKSETFPLERMVDLIGMQMLQQKAQPAPPAGARGTPAAPGAPAAPVAPAAPAGPGTGAAR